MKFRGIKLETNGDNTIEVRSIDTKQLTRLMNDNAICIPTCQRELDEQKVKKFIEVSTDNIDHFKYHCPRIQIGLLFDKYYLIDGQHRCQTFRKIYETTHKIYRIEVVISKLESVEEMEMLYYNLNKENTTLAVPIEELKQAREDRKYYNIVEYLKNTFDESCFAKSKEEKHRYTIERFINKLKKCNIYSMDGIETPKDAIEYIRDKNKKFFDSVIIYNVQDETVRDLVFYKKEIQNIDYECPMMLVRNNFFQFLMNNEIPTHTSRRKRKQINKALRLRIWNEKALVNDCKCYVCKCDITQNNFHTAHIIPYSSGGENKFDNLEATCETCNLQMGDEHMYTYINKIFG